MRFPENMTARNTNVHKIQQCMNINKYHVLYFTRKGNFSKALFKMEFLGLPFTEKQLRYEYTKLSFSK